MKRKNSKLFRLLPVMVIIFISCNKPATVYLSEIKQGYIANEFGPPEIDLSYEKQLIKIRGQIFEKGLGVHAPSKIYIDLNRKAKVFYAVIGVDDISHKLQMDSVNRIASLIKTADYIYDGNKDLFDFNQGGTVRFIITGDGQVIYNSGWLSGKSEQKKVEIDVSRINKLSLEVEKGPDGSFADLADWADAKITYTGNKDDLLIYTSTPDLLINHTGYLPESFKTFRTETVTETKKFSVIDTKNGNEVYTGEVIHKNGDWGTTYYGDFSDFKIPGKYFISIDNRVSYPFDIDEMLYMNNFKKHLNWFLWQRCGDPENGWERGQHRDDGMRGDNHKHQDVSGGWHDAADVRKWGMAINGLWSLSEIYLTIMSDGTPDFPGKKQLEERIKDEFNWGNKYYSAMQEPAGYLMNHVGGDYFKHADNNRFTDNIKGTPDDRLIDVKPSSPVFQYMFVISQCNVSLAEKQKAVSTGLQKAIRCYSWAKENKIYRDIHSLAAAAAAAMKLYECTGEDNYLEDAKGHLRLILSRQDTESSPVNGFIRAWKPGQQDTALNYFPDDKMSNHLITPFFPVWSIVEAIRTIKDPELNNKAREAFNLYFEGYIKYFDNISSFGNVPMGLYRKDPGGSRKTGNYYYRWGYVNNEDEEWWNGINPLLGYAGAYLIRGGLLTGNDEAVRVGQQQIDFIYGCNPFNSSTVTGMGYNQPDFFKTTTYVPHTPEIVGAVMAGIGSSDDDKPVLLPGWWQTTEYWMEAVAGTIMALNELNSYQFSRQIK